MRKQSLFGVYLFSSLGVIVTCATIGICLPLVGADAANLIPIGKWILWSPLLLAPLEFFLLLKLCRFKLELQDNSKDIFILVTFVTIAILPLVVLLITNTFWLDTIVLRRQSLNQKQIEGVQQLPLESSSIPLRFVVHWDADKIQIVFLRGEERKEILRNTLRARFNVKIASYDS